MTNLRRPVLLRASVTVAALGWAVLIVLAPVWDAASTDRAQPTRSTAASLVRLAGGHVCHQRPTRSFHVQGRPLAVCGRCTGLYLSGALGLLVVSVRRRRNGPAERPLAAPPAWWPARFDRRAGWLAAAAVPTLLTWGVEVGGVWNPGTPLRAIAALPFGLAVGWLIGRALDR